MDETVELHVRYEDIRLVARQVRHLVETKVITEHVAMAHAKAREVCVHGFQDQVDDAIVYRPAHRIINIEIRKPKAKKEA